MSTGVADPLTMEVEDVGLTLETVCSSNDVLALAAAEAAEAASAVAEAAQAAPTATQVRKKGVHLSRHVLERSLRDAAHYSNQRLPSLRTLHGPLPVPITRTRHEKADLRVCAHKVPRH